MSGASFAWSLRTTASSAMRISGKKLCVIGTSVSEPHTSEFYCDFSYIYYLSYVVPYILKVTGYLELYDFIYVYIYATKTGILKS